MPALAGQANARIRFLLEPDDMFTEDGWHIDDIAIDVDHRSETVIWGPTPEPTPGILCQNDTLECSWLYNFSPGFYKVTYETTLATDERADNDMLDVVFEVVPATLPSVTVTQPNTALVWQESCSR